MKIFKNAENTTTEVFPTHDFISLLEEENGCLAGCHTGLLFYRQEDYLQGGTHEDQEGFYVLEGTGMALVGEEEFPLKPGCCFIVPPGFYHAIKKDKDSEGVKLFFFHAAV